MDRGSYYEVGFSPEKCKADEEIVWRAREVIPLPRSGNFSLQSENPTADDTLNPA
jgi:hypothetical protein